MRRLALLSPFLLLLGGACLPEPREAAVRVEVTYTFKAGCITVSARDAEALDREASKQLEVLDRGPSTVKLAVFREEGWSHTLEITTTAHERSCAGPVVDQEVHTVELRKARIETLPVTLEAEDVDGDTYVATTDNGTDCDDTLEAIHPGATEVCDNQDNNCDESQDQGVGPSWYPDRDGDGFGDRDATPIVSCTVPTSPPSYVQNASDCRDSNNAVFPRESIPESACDDVDDDCDGEVDDGFALKGTGCSDPCPGGHYVCNASQTGLACGNAPSPLSLLPDDDGDGAGKEDGPSSGSVCPGQPLPEGTAANADDCDDQDPHNRRGRGELCDGRDNTCNFEADEGGVCAGKGWKPVADPALTGNRQWKTVAIGQDGLPVWVAGDGGVLAVRSDAGQPFRNLDGTCGSHGWLSAWVRPSDGVVFLAASNGQVAQHDGATCSHATVNTSDSPIHGITGVSSPSETTLYLVNFFGRLSTWTPGTPPLEHFNLAETFMGIHGRDAALLIGVGGTEEAPQVPHITSYPGTGNTFQRHTLQGLPGGYVGSLRAVWMGSPKLAYAVGDAGLVLQWDGTTTWTPVVPPPDNATASFTSVVVLDRSSIYSTDVNGVIRRLSASGWVASPLHTSDQPLRDLAASSPGDIWAVGDNGRVVHFPE
ncbi:putative metal-binding motif-containing protein [Hyalangium sp.]|uniref:putative metal-binding motif-containing protein n=1 Tax=Hyalangium sp. TaxID=2028555 RepID=UPI002D6D322E|nr:putative metal-binding motif-containing protein [Hyalangium sp.]HYH98564.1 putative metal-binding motif-containing protein [Hyalangium sp.]